VSPSAWQLTSTLKKAKNKKACHQLGPAVRYTEDVISPRASLIIIGDRGSGNHYFRRIRELIKEIFQAAADRRDLE
jgi:hypothetical protein